MIVVPCTTEPKLPRFELKAKAGMSALTVTVIGAVVALSQCASCTKLMLSTFVPADRGWVDVLTEKEMACGEEPVSVWLAMTAPLSSRFTGFVGTGSLIVHQAVNVAMQEKLAPAAAGELAEQLKPVNSGCPMTSWKVTGPETD